jgi:hypothetical protein
VIGPAAVDRCQHDGERRRVFAGVSRWRQVEDGCTRGVDRADKRFAASAGEARNDHGLFR